MYSPELKLAILLVLEEYSQDDQYRILQAQFAGISKTKIKNLLRKAMVEISKVSIDSIRKLTLAQLNMIYNKCMTKEKNYRLALEILKERSKLLGINSPEKQEAVVKIISLPQDEHV